VAERLHAKILTKRLHGRFRIFRTAMELREALTNASQILDEERLHPTIDYERTSRSSDDAIQVLAGIAGEISLMRAREHRPRQIIEDVSRYRFQSANYNLLCALHSRVNESDRQGFLVGIATRLVLAPGCAKNSAVPFPGWNNLSSELPLIAEFLARNHGKAHLMRLLWEAEQIPGHAVMLRQLEEMIALNYTLFTDSQYESLASAVLSINARAKAKEQEYRKINAISVHWPDIGPLSATGLCLELQAASLAIAEQCRKARYLYLKGLLSEGLNLEVNQDKVVVEQYMQQYGFPQTLVQSLNEAERLYRDGTTPFDFKACMTNLRSFLENVHAEAMSALHAKFGGQVPQKWGDGLAYLARNGVLSKTEEQFVASLYTLISDEGVHPLIADKEDARLTCNSVIEYALRFFRKVEILGVKVAIAARP